MNILKKFIVNRNRARLEKAGASCIEIASIDKSKVRSIVKNIREDFNKDNINSTLNELMQQSSFLGRIGHFKNIFSEHANSVITDVDGTKYTHEDNFEDVMKKAHSLDSVVSGGIRGSLRNRAYLAAIEAFTGKVKHNPDPREKIIITIIDLMAVMQYINGALSNIESLLSPEPGDLKLDDEIIQAKIDGEIFGIMQSFNQMEDILEKIQSRRILPPPRPPQKSLGSTILALFRKKTGKTVTRPFNSISGFTNNLTAKLDSYIEKKSVEVEKKSTKRWLHVKAYVHRKKKELKIAKHLKKDIEKLKLEIGELNIENSESFNLKMYELLKNAIYKCKKHDNKNKLNASNFRRLLHDQMSGLSSTADAIYKQKLKKIVEERQKQEFEASPVGQKSKELAVARETLEALLNSVDGENARNKLDAPSMKFVDNNIDANQAKYIEILNLCSKLSRKIDKAINNKGSGIEDLEQLLKECEKLGNMASSVIEIVCDAPQEYDYRQYRFNH